MEKPITQTELLLDINSLSDSIAEYLVDDSPPREANIQAAFICAYRIIGLCQKALVDAGAQPTVDPEIWQPIVADEWDTNEGEPFNLAMKDAYARSLLRGMVNKGMLEEGEPDMFRCVPSADEAAAKSSR